MSLVTIKRAVSEDSGDAVSPTAIDFVDTKIELNLESIKPKNESKSKLQSLRCDSQSFVMTQYGVFNLEHVADLKPSFIARKRHKKHVEMNEFQEDFDRIFKSLRVSDNIKMTIRLEEKEEHRLYFSILVNAELHQSLIVGYTFSKTRDNPLISMVIPCKNIENILLLGDGGFMINAYGERGRTFYPKSIKCLWNTVQLLYEILHKIPYMKKRQQKEHEYRYYYERLVTDPKILSLWNKSPSIQSIVKLYHEDNIKHNCVYKRITALIQEVMNEQNINSLTMRQIKHYLRQNLDIPLTEYSTYIDDEVMRIFGQMDECSKITEYLYLGSEWNASDVYSLEKKGIKAILNATIEVDNFFPGHFDYFNIGVYDVPESDLMSYFDAAYRFIDSYRSKSDSVLVHCQMGKSRSATIVISYLMKHFNWSRELAQHYVKSKRSIIDPNSGFVAQLDEYEGILNSSRNREVFSPVRSNSNIFPELNNEHVSNKRNSDIPIDMKGEIVKRIRSYNELTEL